MFVRSIFAVMVVASVTTVAFADEFTSINFKVLDPVIAPSGFSSSASFQLFSSVAEIGSGRSTAASFGTHAGFLNFPTATSPAVSATPGDAQVVLSWTVSQGFGGWTPLSYSVGQSVTAGGPYTYANVGNVTSSTRTGLTNGTTYRFVIVTHDAYGNVIATSTEVSAAPVSSGGGAGSAGSGGGGGGGGAAPATVVLSGRAYPGSTVTILRDARIVSESVIQESAAFAVTVSNLNAGSYLFGVYATDTEGNQSPTITIPVTVASGVATDVSGIFVAPTITIDKTQVKRGDPVRVFGQSAPSSTITISVHSEEELFFQAKTDRDGVYSYSFLTTPLALGEHTTHSISSREGQVSRTSRSLAFTVGTTTVLASPPQKTDCKTPEVNSDANCDARTNIIDFSIVAFWYKKANPPAKYDMNKDGIVNIIDFSIMASHWTG